MFLFSYIRNVCWWIWRTWEKKVTKRIYLCVWWTRNSERHEKNVVLFFIRMFFIIIMAIVSQLSAPLLIIDTNNFQGQLTFSFEFSLSAPCMWLRHGNFENQYAIKWITTIVLLLNEREHQAIQNGHATRGYNYNRN